MCVFLISPVPIAEPLTSELIDTPVFYNLAPRPIKYRVSVPIPSYKDLIYLHYKLSEPYKYQQVHIFAECVPLNETEVFFSPQVWVTDTVHRACMRPVTFLELVIWSRIELKSSKTKEKSTSCMAPLDSDLLSAPEHLGEVFSHLGGATQAHSPRVVDHTGHSQQRGRPCQSRYYAWTETRERATRLFWTQKCSAWQLKHSFIMKPF